MKNLFLILFVLSISSTSNNLAFAKKPVEETRVIEKANNTDDIESMNIPDKYKPTIRNYLSKDYPFILLEIFIPSTITEQHTIDIPVWDGTYCVILQHTPKNPQVNHDCYPGKAILSAAGNPSIQGFYFKKLEENIKKTNVSGQELEDTVNTLLKASDYPLVLIEVIDKNRKKLCAGHKLFDSKMNTCIFEQTDTVYIYELTYIQARSVFEDL